MMPDLLLVGGGGHALAVIDVIEREGRWRIAGVVDPRLSLEAHMGGYPVLGTDEALTRLRSELGHALITVGQIRSPAVRMSLYRNLLDLGYTLPVVISPTAELSRRARVGSGTVVMHFAAIGPGAEVGANCIINSRALVEHDTRIGDHCHISTGALLNGAVRVGDGTFVGSGSVVRQGVAIGAGCLVAMGSVVRHDLADGSRSARKS